MTVERSEPSPTTAAGAAADPARPSPPRTSAPRSVFRLRDPADALTWIIPAPSPRGLAASVALHSALLVVLGLWYFTIPARRSIEFDGRLAGSPDGVPNGLLDAGGPGLDAAPILIPPEAPFEAAPPVPESLPPLQSPLLDALDPAPTLAGARRPAGGVPGTGAGTGPGAGDGDGFGLPRFGFGGELVRGVEVKTGDPQFTLLWNTDADLDLHVVEPGGKEIFWESPKGAQGGELDVDNTRGFGPENVYWLVDSDGPGADPVKGSGPPGVYRWFVVYYGGFGGIAKPTHWKVRIKHGGAATVYDGKLRALNERSKIHTLKVAPAPDRLRTAPALTPAPAADASPAPAPAAVAADRTGPLRP